MKNVLRDLTVALALLAGAVVPASAQGIPVIDATAIAKAVEQLVAWKKQYDQMVEQIKTSKDQLAAMTGQRNLGAIIDNIGSNAMVAPEVVAQWRQLTKREEIAKSKLAVIEQALSTTMARSDQVRALMQSMNSTSDMKAAAEINGRIQAETTLVMNDMQRVQLMQQQESANVQRIEQQYKDNVVRQLQQPPARW